MRKKIIAVVLSGFMLAGCSTIGETAGVGALVGAGLAVATGGGLAAGALIGAGAGAACHATNYC